MKLDSFIENFASQFEDTDSSAFQSDTEFKNIEEWSSLLALSLIAMVDESYGVRIKGEDIKNANTILDLFNLVQSKL